jgi:hypothetical protein
MFHSHAKTHFLKNKLMHFEAFKSLVKYISCYEMAWKLTFIIHQHVIEYILGRK